MKKIFLLKLLTFGFVIGFAQSNIPQARMYTPANVNFKPGEKAMCDTNISYSGAYTSAIGAGAQTWEGGIYFDTVQTKFYGDTTWIEAIQFYLADTTALNDARVRIYEGTTISGEELGNTITNGTLVFDSVIAHVDLIQDDFTIVVLDSSYLIKKNMGYSIFVQIEQTTAGKFPLGVSDGPMVLGRGGWISLGGYQQMVEANDALDYNWMINACVRGDVIIPEHNLELSGGVFNPTGYAKLPFDQIKPNGYSFETSVKNLGTITATGVTSKFKIDDVEKGTLTHGSIPANVINTKQSLNVTIDSTVGIHDVRMDCFMDSVDFNPSDNKAFGKYEITENYYSRTSQTSFYITGEFLGGNAYDFESNSVITESVVSVTNATGNEIPSDYPMYVALFNVDKGTGNVNGFPLAMSDTIFASDTLEVNNVYEFNFKFKYPLPVLEGQTILAAFNNPTAGIRRFDNPPVYESNTCFVGNYSTNDSIFEFGENTGVYYIIDLVLDRTIFGIENRSSFNNIKIYPNPSNGIINISNLENTKSIKIFDVTGRLVYSKEGSIRNTEIINISTNKGLYFVEIINNYNDRNFNKLIVK